MPQGRQMSQPLRLCCSFVKIRRNFIRNAARRAPVDQDVVATDWSSHRTEESVKLPVASRKTCFSCQQKISLGIEFVEVFAVQHCTTGLDVRGLNAAQ